MACLELILKCVSVNGIIRLMGSVCLGPKVIPLSGAHCTKVEHDALTADQDQSPTKNK